MKIITPKLHGTEFEGEEKDKYKLKDTTIHTFPFSHFIKQISHFKWNWSKNRKLTIKADMPKEEALKFIQTVAGNVDMSDVTTCVIELNISPK